MPKINPFTMQYRNYEVRLTHIKSRRISSLAPKKFQYKFNLSVKKDGKTSEFKKQVLDANSKRDLENQIRVLLLQLNY